MIHASCGCGSTLPLRGFSTSPDTNKPPAGLLWVLYAMWSSVTRQHSGFIVSLHHVAFAHAGTRMFWQRLFGWGVFLSRPRSVTIMRVCCSCCIIKKKVQTIYILTASIRGGGGRRGLIYRFGSIVWLLTTDSGFLFFSFLTCPEWDDREQARFIHGLPQIQLLLTTPTTHAFTCPLTRSYGPARVVRRRSFFFSIIALIAVVVI